MNLVAMRFGGYPEQIRAMADVLRKGAGIETIIENHKIILHAQHKAYKRSITHDGIYAEGTKLCLIRLKLYLPIMFDIEGGNFTVDLA